MKRRGFDYTTPNESFSTSCGRITCQLGRSRWCRWISIAKYRTNLVAAAVAVQSTYDTRYIQDNRGALDKLSSQLDADLRGEPYVNAGSQ